MICGQVIGLDDRSGCTWDVGGCVSRCELGMRRRRRDLRIGLNVVNAFFNQSTFLGGILICSQANKNNALFYIDILSSHW